MSPPERMTERQALLWDLADFGHGHGLEIGPLHSAIVPKGTADVSYVDVFSRDELLANWAHDPGVDPVAIPELDYVLGEGGRVRSLPETIGPDERFDWVMASHVVEHVPDLVGWLDQIAEITVDGGALVLAVPDRRYCFDLHRPGTTVGQLLEAHERGDTVPSPRAVYDYKRGHASVRAPMVWANNPVGYENRIFTLDQVRDFVARAKAGEYIDSHVWLFTPGTLLEQVIELRTLGLAQWRVETIVPTAVDRLEFYAVLRRLPRAGWDESTLAGEPAPGRMPDWLAETVAVARERDAARAELAELRAALGPAPAPAPSPAATPALPLSRRVRRRLRRRFGHTRGWAIARRVLTRR